MARTLEDITNQILQRKEATPELDQLTSTSRVAIWRLWVDVFAFCIWVLEQLFDTHKAEVLDYLQQLTPHTARWYRNKALAFQYGFDLLEDSDKYDNSQATETQIETAKIITYAAVVEAEVESRLIIKIATEQNHELSPISQTEQDAFTAYMQEVKDAGVRLTIINYLPDLLRLKLRIYRDPLVLDENGVNRITGIKPVEIALQQYMRELPFNGELVLQEMANKLEQAEGIKIIQIDEASTTWVEPGIGYGDFQTIDVRSIPVSGYFKIQNFDDVSYVV